MRITLFLLFFQAFTGFCQTTPYHYPISADVTNQLIYCLEQDDAGRLLIGTDKGLFRYNGFKSVHLKTTGAFSKEIIQLVKLKDRFLACNRAGQILELKKDQVKALKLEGLSADIRKIAIDGNELIVTTSKEVRAYDLSDYSLINAEIVPFAELPGVLVNDVITFKGARYATLNSGELVEVDDQEARYIPNATGKQLISFGGKLVIIPLFTANENVYTYQSGYFKSHGSLLPRRNVKVTKAIVRDNQLFVLSDYGVFVFTNSINSTPKLWFEGMAITDLFVDKDKNWWLTTKGKGLVFVPSGKHEMINAQSFLSLERGVKGTFFGGTVNGNVLQFDRTGKIMREFAHPFSNQEVQYLHFDPTAQILSTNNTFFQLSNALPALLFTESIKGMARTKKGELLLAKSTGVVLFSNMSTKQLWNKLTDSTAFKVLSTSPSRQIAQNESTGTIAFNTLDGVYLINETNEVEAITYYGKAIDAQQLVWFKNDLYVATTDNLLLLIRNKKVIKERRLNEGGGDVLIQKLAANDSFLYVLTEKGMVRISGIDSKIETWKDVLGFEGLALRDFTLEGDFIYLATQRGVLRFVWSKDNQSNYNLVMGVPYSKTTVQADSIAGPIRFPAGERLITVPFECVDLSGNHQFLVQYRIHTEDERGVWNSVAVNSEKLSLSHLSAGDYTIEMRIFDPLSRNVTPIQSRKFRLEASWYNSNWWWFLSGGATFLVFYLIWKSYRKRQFRTLPS